MLSKQLFPSSKNELFCAKMTSFCLFAYSFDSLVTESHYQLGFGFILPFSHPLGWSLPPVRAVSTCSGCRAALQHEGVLGCPPPPTHQPPLGTAGAGVCCRLSATGSEPFVFGRSRREGAAGNHTGENTAGADATHCWFLPGFWKGKVLAGSACHGHSRPSSIPDQNKLLFIVYRGRPSLPAASIPTNAETRKQCDRILCLYFVNFASLVIAFYILMNSSGTS